MKALPQLARNATMSAVMNLANRAAGVLVLALVARTAGAGAAGVFSLALTYLVIFTALTWGFDELVVRQVARQPAEAPQFLGSFLTLRVVVSLALYAALVLLVTQMLPYAPRTASPILVIGLSLITDNLSYAAQAVLMALGRFEIPLRSSLLAGGIKLAGGLIVLAAGGGLQQVAWIWVAGSLVGALYILYVARRRVGLGQAAGWFQPLFWRPLWRPMLPFMVIGLLTTIEYQTDVVILSLVQDEAEVGWYSAATTFVFALGLVPQAFRMAVYPLMAHYQAVDQDKLWLLYQRSLRYLAILALPLAAGLALLAPQAVRLVYGPGFERAALALRLVVWTVIFSYLNVPTARLMLVSEQQTWATLFLVSSLTVNLTMNLLLAPRWGAPAAALARACSTAVFAVGMALFVAERVHRVNWLRLLASPLLATAAMSAVLWFLPNTSLIWLVPAGAAVYVVCLLATGGMPKEDRRMVTAWLQRAWTARTGWQGGR